MTELILFASWNESISLWNSVKLSYTILIIIITNFVILSFLYYSSGAQLCFSL